MTRASDLAKLLGAGATILDGTTITTSDNTEQLSLVSTDADASIGPILRMDRQSASAADGDLLGKVNFVGHNDAGTPEDISYASITGIINDASDGTEDGKIAINTIVAGTEKSRIFIDAGETVFNEESADLDFRVESNGNANMLFVDGGNDRVGIGTNSVFEPLRVQADSDTDFDASSAEFNRAIMLKNSTAGANNAVSIALATEANGEIYLSCVENASNNAADFVISSRASGARAERLRITGGGILTINTNNANVAQSNISGALSYSPSAQLEVNGNNTGAASFGRTDDGRVIDIYSAGTREGSIDVSGTNVTIASFTGVHWSRFSDNSQPNIYRGTVLENIDEMCDWYQAKITIASTTEKQTIVDDDGNEKITDVTIPERTIKDSIELPSGKKVGDTISHTHDGITYDDAIIIKEDDNKHTKCKISDTADSKIVYGVFSHWDLEDDTVNDMNVAAVGTHVVRINKDVTVSAGDLLVSNGDGTAKVQDDDIIRSKTIGKVLTNIKQETYSDESYTVPCALYCG